MRIAIVDDNKLHRNKMKQVLKECRKKDDISDFENIRDYERSEGVYELLLLDIELKDEKGIRYIKNNPQKHRYVVYVSSYPEMMGEAFHSNVLGFIPKDKINALLVDKVNEVEQEIKKDKLYKIDIVGFLYKKGGMTREDVGQVDVKEHYAFVAVRRSKIKQLLTLIRGEKIKGIKTIIEEAK